MTFICCGFRFGFFVCLFVITFKKVTDNLLGLKEYIAVHFLVLLSRIKIGEIKHENEVFNMFLILSFEIYVFLGNKKKK